MKPKFLQTSGIILRTRRFGEFDLWVTILTRDFGKIEAKARGARRPRAKLRALNSPLATISLEFIPSQKIPTITGLKIQKSRTQFATDLERYRLGAALAEILDHTLQTTDSTYAEYHLADHALDQILTSPRPILPFTHATLHLLSQLGFSAPLKQCSLCQSPITTDHIHLTPQGLACDSCHSDLHCSLDVAKILHHLQKQNIETPTPLNITPTHSSELLSHIRFWTESLISRPLRSLT